MRSGTLPLCRDIPQGQPDEFRGSLVAGKVPLVPNALANAAVQALDRIRGVKDLPHGRRESEKRNDPVPMASPALGYGGKTPSPLAAFECAQRPVGRLGIVGLIDRLQSLGQGLAILSGRRPGRILDQVHDTGLHDRVRTHRCNRLGKALQAVDDRDQDILHPAGFQVVHHPQPELGTFGLLDPQAEDLISVARATREESSLCGYEARTLHQSIPRHCDGVADPQAVQIGRTQRRRLL